MMNRSNKVLDLFKDFKNNRKHGFAVLIDPDKIRPEDMPALAQKCVEAKVDFLFVGGSLVLEEQMDSCIQLFKQNCEIPVVLFPGSPSQVSKAADALLYLSLISGRNADLLIGQHVSSALKVRQSGLEVIPTGYMNIDGGVPTTVSYMSHSLPIPHNKSDIALCTAWAGEMLGKQIIYMDAGSGALQPIHNEMIHKVSQNINIPLIVGGGLDTPQKVKEKCNAGADIIVVGNALEKDIDLILALSKATKETA
jgi:phosphoglycerol geranylgeranyltransferase